MDLEADTLRWCKTPHLERLARRLGVSLPAPGTNYHRQLARRVAEGIGFDKRRHAAEERRMTEAARVAEKIAESLGEIGDRPKAQIRRIVGLMGAQWTCAAAEYAVGFHGDPSKVESVLMRDVAFRKDGSARPVGGVFFAWCRRTASDAVKEGRITRRQFFRAFTDRPKVPKVAKTVPVRPGGKKARKDVTHNWGVPRTHDKRSKAPVPVEVYVTRRRA